MNRRGGATTSLILGIAGVIGVGVAGGMALTGTTPCSLMQACGVKKATPALETVAMAGDTAAVCPITGKKAEATPASMAAAASDCCAEDAAAKATTVALADCSNDPECAVDDGVACSTKGADCHKVQPATAGASGAAGVQVHVVTASQTQAKGEECAMAASCSPANCTEGMMKACTDSGKVCPQDQSAHAGAKVVAAASKPALEIAPDALRPLFGLQFTGKGMPMLIPATMLNASACETKDAGACGGESACSDEKKAACGDGCASATTASLR